MEAQSAHRTYSFGEFTLDIDRCALLRAGAEVKLRPKSFAVLSHLVEHHGRLVTKAELLESIWGHTVVTEGSLTQCLIDVRRAIGDESQRMIRTVARRGYVFELPVTVHEGAAGLDSQPPAPESPVLSEAGWRRLRWRLTAVLVVILGAAAVWWGTGPWVELPWPEPGSMTEAPVSIAVLPFVDLSPAQDQAYLSDGIAEELLNRLAQNSALRVIARTSSFSFKGQNVDIATIAERLNVSHVLEGSVRKSGERIRITAQLVDAATSSHLWSETYDRGLDDVFAVQDEIAAAVADALGTTLAGGEGPAIPVAGNIQAYERSLQGRFFYNRRAPGDMERARDYYQQALEIDPEYAPAWAGLVGVYNVQVGDGSLSPEVGLVRQREAIERALALDPELAEVRARAAYFYYWNGPDRYAAMEHYRKAWALDSNNPLLLSISAGFALWEGRLEEAIELQRRAVSLDPVSFVHRSNLATYLFNAGRFEEAEAEYLRAAELNPSRAHEIDVGITHCLIGQQQFDEALVRIEQWPEGEDRDQALALVNHALGRRPEADAALERLTAAPGPSAAVRLAELYAWRGEIDESFRWLATFRNHVPDLRPTDWRVPLRARVSPFLKPLHADSRWAQWLADSENIRRQRVSAETR